MTRSTSSLAFFAAISFVLPAAIGGGGKGGDSKEALQALQDFIGGWKGSVDFADRKKSGWKESVNWGWKFKGKDVWLTVEAPGSKLFKEGEMRFLPDKEKYQMTLTDAKGGKAVFLGEMKKNALVLERTNPTTKDLEQIKISSAGGGVRLVHEFAIKPADRTIFNKQYQIAYTKDGESFGASAAKKGPECVVTGGLGTIQVSFMGTTYYVCCSGCRDAFNENPAKMIAEYKARKAKGE